LQALAEYKSQQLGHRRYFERRELLAQLRFWGAYTPAYFAEAFEVVRVWV